MDACGLRQTQNAKRKSPLQPQIGNCSSPSIMFTTNEEDQREAARLQARLADAEGKSTNTGTGARIPNVTIADGAHKYVLISAVSPGGGQRQNFVVSQRGAAYHRNAAEPMVEALERSGYNSIDVSGGGRIFLDEENKRISIFGHSYGFGQADHALSKAVVDADPRYQDFDVTWSNEGY